MRSQCSKWILAVLVAVAMGVTACGPDDSIDESSPGVESTAGGAANVVYCRHAWWCKTGTYTYKFFFTTTTNSDYAVQRAKCQEAVAAGLCTGTATGDCTYSPSMPLGCTPR